MSKVTIVYFLMSLLLYSTGNYKKRGVGVGVPDDPWEQKTIEMLFMTIFGGFVKWIMKRKNVDYIWKYQQMTKLKNGFSLPEQKERLEAFCKFKGYEIIDYYEDAGIRAKTGNYRPEYERLKEDIKAK